MKRLRYVPSADDDFARLFRWYWKKASTQPSLIFAEVTRLANKIVINPHQYAKVDRCPTTRDVRITQSAKRRMIVIYETTTNDVMILSITHKLAKRRPWRTRLDEV